MPGRAPEAAEGANEPTGVDFLRSPATPSPKRAIPGAEAGLHLTASRPGLYTFAFGLINSLRHSGICWFRALGDPLC